MIQYKDTNYYYKIYSNGYEIYFKDKLLCIQKEPYIPNSFLSYEQNAIQQIQQLEGEHITNFLTLEERIERLEQLMNYFINQQQIKINLPEIKLDKINEII